MSHGHDHLLSPRLMKAYLDRVTAPELEKIGITPSSSTFLIEILHHEGISLKELSELLLVDKAHTTRMVNKLIEAGLVENKAEGHQYSLRLTESGREVTIKAVEINSDATNQLYKDLTPEEMESLRAISAKVYAVLRKVE